ncbi:MAG: hypothetical protein V3R80_06725 [Candidatus Tectomicrobia bacterium]
MSHTVDGQVQEWTERRLVVRSVRQAHAAEAGLRARVAQAITHIEALNQRGRGKKRFEEVSALRQAVVAIVQRYGVEDFVWFRVTGPHPAPGARVPGAARSAGLQAPGQRFTIPCVMSSYGCSRQ